MNVLHDEVFIPGSKPVTSPSEKMIIVDYSTCNDLEHNDDKVGNINNLEASL